MDDITRLLEALEKGETEYMANEALLDEAQSAIRHLYRFKLAYQRTNGEERQLFNYLLGRIDMLQDNPQYIIDGEF